MYRVIKVIAAAAAIAVELSTGMPKADAQAIGTWNLVRPTNYYLTSYSQSGQIVYTLYVYTSSFTVTLRTWEQSRLRFCPATLAGLSGLLIVAALTTGHRGFGLTQASAKGAWAGPIMDTG
jgi:hypothetical protein